MKILEDRDHEYPKMDRTKTIYRSFMGGLLIGCLIVGVITDIRVSILNFIMMGGAVTGFYLLVKVRT